MTSQEERADDGQRRQLGIERAQTERIRAARRRKILENASSRMEKVYNMQQW